MHTANKIQYKTTVNAPVEKVWDALTNPEIVKKYFFGTQLASTFNVGDSITFKGEWEGQQYVDGGKVLDYVHNQKLEYSYLSSWSGLEDLPENYLWVCYEVASTENGTEVTISQSNYDEEKAKSTAENWPSIIDGLKKLIE